MSVNKTPNGRWRARVKSGRETVATKTFDLQRDAKAWADAQKRALALGDFVDPRAGKESLGSVITRWVDEREGTVSGSTLKADKALLKNVRGSMLHRPISAVRASDVESLLAELTRRGLAPTSVRRFRAVMSSMFTWAIGQKLIATNAVLEAKLPKGDGTASHREVYPFTIPELRSVVEDLETVDRTQGEVALVLGLTGLRWGELVALRVRDVTTVPRPALRVVRSASDGQAVKFTTKSGRARTVPLTAELVPLLTVRCAGKHPDDLVFVSANGHRLNGPNWSRATKWSLLNRGRRVHDLRHTAATFWLSNGVDPKTVQTWLGHESMTVTVDRYSHWMGHDADDAAILRIDAVLGDAGGTRPSNLRAVE